MSEINQIETRTESAESAVVADLWRDFRATGNAEIREQIIERYMPYARMLAAKHFAKRTTEAVEFSDYMQFACVGLMESIDRFDPDYGAKFETYSSTRIAGAILNGIESLNEKQQQIGARRRILSDRVSSVKKKSAKEGQPGDLFAYLAEIAMGLAVGFVLEDSGMFQQDELTYPDNSYQSIELRQLQRQVQDLVADLPTNQRRVLSYHYLNQIPFEEIAQIMQLSKGRISQIHKEALQSLKARLSRPDKLDLRF